MQASTGVQQPEGPSRRRAGFRGPRWVIGLGRWGQALRTPLGITAATLLGLVLLLAVVGPVLWGDRADAIDTDAMSEGPSGTNWLGTDSLGRDIFARVLVAARLSVTLALLATVIGFVVGMVLGAAPWLLGRRFGRLAMATINVAVAFPALLLVLFFAVIFGVGIRGAVMAVGLGMAPYFARITSTLVAGVAGRDYIAAARIAGFGRVQILLRHIVPNIGEPLIVNAALGAGGAFLAFAGLSFLGLGVQPPSYDWGVLLNEGLNHIYVGPAGALAPGGAIVLAGLAFNLTGEVIAKKIGLHSANVRVDAVDSSAAVSVVQGAPPANRPDAPVLTVEDLHVTVTGPAGPVTPVRGVSFTIGRAETVGLVGESGSGKSLTALAVAQLIEAPNCVEARRMEFLGTDLLQTGGRAKDIGHLLGTSLGVVFQDPSTSLNPTMRVGRQLDEVVRRHLGKSCSEARARTVDRLQAARVPAPERRANQYPHEFSGGMRQRAMIAMSMMGDPALIVADEPTTALDVTVQRQVLRLLEEIRVHEQVAVLLISHDITVVRQVCDRVLVMYAGRVVEDLPSNELRTEARHPYTRALLSAVPSMTTDRDRPLTVIPGRPVEPAHFPPGCAFADRCPLVDDHCRANDPPLVAGGAGRRVACWHQGESLARATEEDDIQTGGAS